MPIMFEISPALMLHILKINIQAAETCEQCWDRTELSEVHYWKSSLLACSFLFTWSCHVVKYQSHLLHTI